MRFLIFVIFLSLCSYSWSRSITILNPVNGTNVPASSSTVTLSGTVDSVVGGVGSAACNNRTVTVSSNGTWIRAIPLAEAGPNIITCTYTKDSISASSSIVVNWAGNIKPHADYSYDTDGLTLSVDASLSFDSDGNITSYEWDFGSGYNAGGVNASHVFTAPGDYLVKLKVYDNHGSYKARARMISVAGDSGVKPVIVVSNTNPNSFSDIGSDLELAISSGSFNSDKAKTLIIHNDRVLSSSEFDIYSVGGSSRINISNILVKGKNEFQVYTANSNDEMFEFADTVWAGNESVEVTVKDNGAIVPNANVKMQLSSDPSVYATGVTNSQGKIIFTNLPFVSVTFFADLGNKHGNISYYTENDEPVTIEMIQVLPVSSIQNNDFSLGTQGWNLGHPAEVSVVDHVESRGGSLVDINEFRSMCPDKKRTKSKLSRPTKSLSKSSLDKDLRILTVCEDEREPTIVRRSYATNPGTRKVVVRFKFFTSQFQHYYGRRFDDRYEIFMMSKNTGKIVRESRSMNSFPPSAYVKVPVSGGYEDDVTYIGELAEWREVVLDVDPDGDEVMFEAKVMNVGDDSYEAGLTIDYINESKFGIEKATLFDIDNGPLKYISLSGQNVYKLNSSNQARTLIKGSLEVYGDMDDFIKSIELRIFQNGAVKAIGKLDTDGDSSLVDMIKSPFGVPRRKFINQEQLFSILNNQASLVDVSQNGPVSLQIVAESNKGYKAKSDLITVTILSRYPYHGLDRRYDTERDLAYGGDDWGQPKTISILNLLHTNYGTSHGFRIGDISNMNGGLFDHQTHQRGSHVDAYVTGYESFSSAAATKLLDVMQQIGDDLMVVYVTTPLNAGNPFYDVLNAPSSMIGTSNRKASSFLQYRTNHITHFHIQVKEYGWK